MAFPIRCVLAAAALACTLTVAQAQTTQQTTQGTEHTAHRHTGQGMSQGERAAMGAQGHHMMMGGGEAGMMPMMQPRHVEGRIAFLKTELKITDAQSQQWGAFADVLRGNAKAMTTMHGSMMNDGKTASAPQRADRQVQMMSTCLEAMKAFAGAETTLDTVLSDDQKKAADELLSMPMGSM